MSFDQVFSEYVTSLNKFYQEQDQASYDNLIAKRTLMQQRDANMLKALQEIAAADHINGQLSYVATKALKDIGE